MNNKKTRVDTAAGEQEAFANAMLVIEPPKQLSDEELFYWNYITEARPAREWTQIDLMHAWNLAKQMLLLEQTYEALSEEGMTLVNERGTPVDNPAITRIDKLTRLIMSVSAKLKIHAEATVGESRDMAKRATAQRNAKGVVESTDDLIAKPLH